MERDQVRQAVSAQVFQSLNESGVQITAIPQPQLQALVSALADGVFAALAVIEDENTSSFANRVVGAVGNGSSGGAVEEKLLWRGRPYLTIGTVYEITTQRIRILRGILGNKIEEIELVRVRDTRVKQHVGERVLNVGDVTVISNDATAPEVTLNNVPNPIEVREIIRKAVMEEKERRGLRYREDM